VQDLGFCSSVSKAAIVYGDDAASLSK